MPRLNYYDVLGIKKNSTEIEIKNAYRKLALQYHPDRNKNEDSYRRFIEITEAKELLLDYEKRMVYDYEYFNNGVFKEKKSESVKKTKTSHNHHKSYQNETNYQRIDNEGNDFDKLSQKIREITCMTLDVFFEIVRIFCSKVIKFDLTKESVSHFIQDSVVNMRHAIIQNCIWSFEDVTGVDYKFDYEYIVEQSEVEEYSEQIKSELKNFHNKLMILLKGFRGGRKSRWIQEKWINDNFDYDKNYKIREHAMIIREKTFVKIEQTIFEFFKNLNDTKNKKNNSKYTSFGYAVPHEQVPDGAFQDISPLGSTVIPDIYQRIMLEILLHLKSLTKIICLQGICIEENIEKFEKSKFGK